jgi:cathepsin A (carboxypeptidase C)
MKQLASVLDASKTFTHRRGKDNIRLLVLNGNEDGLCNTPGVKWVYDRLSWSGAAGYRARRWKDLKDIGLEPELATGEWKNSKDGQLLLLGVDGAGHMMPMDKPEAADWIVRKWIAGDI